MGVESGDEIDNNTYKLMPIGNTTTAMPKRDIERNRPICHPRTFWKQFQDYSENTTIHGLKYLGEKRSIFEKVWWILGFIICVVCLILFIYQIWDKWQKSPVILALDDEPTPVYKFPFPAVTICPETKLRIKYAKFSYSEMISKIDLNPYGKKPNWTQDEITNFETISHACDYKKVQNFGRFIWGYDRNNTLTDYKLFERFQEMTYNQNDALVECKFGRYSCEDLYSEIFTEMGLCFTFNFVDDLLRNYDTNMTENFSFFNKFNYEFDTGYAGPKTSEEFPHRVTSVGQANGLHTILFTDKADKNYNCRSEQGYRITLHSPAEYPQPSKSFIPIGHGENVNIKIKPVKITSSHKLRRYEPIRRQCYFQNERTLRYFTWYNQMNCRLECISNITNQVCGCVQFGIPRGSEIPICGAGSIGCYGRILTRAVNTLLINKYNTEYNIKNKNPDILTMDDCDCLPECNSIRYEATIERAEYDMLKDSQDNLISTNFNNTLYEASKFRIFYEEVEYLGQMRTELYGVSDLVSNFGGLMGLFLGGSILSLVELLYFCTIRACCRCNDLRSNENTNL